MKSFSIFALLVAIPLLMVRAEVENGDQISSIGTHLVEDVIVHSRGGTAAANSEDYVISRVSAVKGGFVSQSDLSRDQRELLDTGIFSDVRIMVENVADGIRVTYDVSIAPRFRSPLIVKGNKALSERKIRNVIDLSTGDRIDQPSVDVRCDKLRAEYFSRYYSSAKVTSSISEPDEEGFSTVTVTVNEGRRQRISNFEFSGNTAFSSSALSSLLGKPSRYNPVPFFYTGWRKMALDFEHVRDTVIEYYRNAGYLDVNVSAAEIVYADDIDDSPVMKFTIEEGSRYTIDSVSVAGVSVFPQTVFDGMVATSLPVGAVASANNIAASAKMIRDYYGSRGYVDTYVKSTLTPKPVSADSATRGMTVDFIVSEGVLASIRSISIRGNTYTKDKVIRRELNVTPGKIFNEVAAENSRRRIENLGFFESVRFNEIPARDDPAQRDLIYDVKEKNTGNLMLGIGTSSTDNILGYFELAQNNFDISNWPTFRGGGQKLRLSGELGSDSSSGELSLTEPWFLDRRQSLTIDIHRREIGYSEYDETRIGGSLALTVPFKYGRGTISLSAEQVSSDDIVGGTYTLFDDPGTQFSFKEAINDSYMRVPLRLSWLYDTRDRPFIPTRGTRNILFTEIQSSSFGSEYDLYKIGIDLRQYMPLWFNHVLSLRVRAESIDCYGDTDEIPVNERLYLGGARTIRGYRSRDVGPKAIPDSATGRRARPVGGQTMAFFSAEYTIPIVDLIRFAAFFDIGNAWSDSFSVDTGEYASDWGIGVRLDIPGFPIQLYYAFPLDSDDDYSRKEHFIFAMGFE